MTDVAIEVLTGPTVVVDGTPRAVVLEVDVQRPEIVIFEEVVAAIETDESRLDLIVEDRVALEVYEGADTVIELQTGPSLVVLESITEVVEVIVQGPQGRPGVGGSFLPRQISTSDTADYGEIIEADATVAGFSVTLPAPTANKTPIRIKKVDATMNVVLVMPPVGVTIDGLASYEIFAPKMAIDFVPTGTTWLVA